MPDGYLLDTNAAQDWYTEKNGVAKKINSLPDDTVIKISCISVGEIEFGGNLFLRGRDHAALADFEMWMRKKFPKGRILTLTDHTGACYGKLKARLRESFSLPDQENNPEHWFSPTVATVLGIEENDLWIAAQAIEHQLVLVSRDKMEAIRSAAEAEDLYRLRYEDWS